MSYAVFISIYVGR